VSLLRLNLHVQAQIEHGFLGLRDVAALVASDAATELAEEGLVEEAGAFSLGAVTVFLRR
jgi:hypothetical protein